MKFIRLIAALLPTAVFVLILLQSVVSNELAGSGKNTLVLDQSIEALRSENELLRQQLAEQASLVAIETKAKELGFGYSASTITLTPANVAYNPTQ